MRTARIASSGPVQTARQKHRPPDTSDPFAERAPKKRRLVQIGSSPPPFTTASHHVAPSSRLHREKGCQRANSASASPTTTRRRHIVLVQKKNPLQLRSSSPASPPPSHPAPTERALAVSGATRLASISEARLAAREANRDALKRTRQLDQSDPSSPIGTFGGQLLGRSDRSLRSSRIGLKQSKSRDAGAGTVGLPALGHAPPPHRRVGPRAHAAQPAELAGANDSENANAAPPRADPKRTAAKRTLPAKIVEPRRHKAKIQRVQLGAALPPSSANQQQHQPLSEADRHLNSQPEASGRQDADLFDAADESEISYFPTLPPTRLSSDEARNDADRTAFPVHSASADQPTVSADLGPSPTSAPIVLRLGSTEPSAATLDHDAEEGDPSVGLLEVLSQSAIRKIDEVRIKGAVFEGRSHYGGARSEPVDKSRVAEAQHLVNVNFDPSHYTHEQVRHIAASVINKGKAYRQRWSAVEPECVPPRWTASEICTSRPERIVEAPWRPPSYHVVCQDLGLSSSQLRKGPLTELPVFTRQCAGSFRDDGPTNDGDDLDPFEHRLRFAGYRLSNAISDFDPVSNAVKTHKLPQLQPFSADAFQKRMQTRRKEVVKVVIPFSAPTLSPLATRARFAAPHAPVKPQAQQPQAAAVPDNRVVLLWMQSTATNFLHALETMVQAGVPRSAQNSGYSFNSTECELYPCPILHYAAHADASHQPTPAHVTLYVHLDRVEEARQRLAALELGHAEEVGGMRSCRPFSDPLVRLLVTSLHGEPLCLV